MSKLLQFCLKQNSQLIINSRTVFYVSTMAILATGIPLLLLVITIIISIISSLTNGSNNTNRPPNGINNKGTGLQQEQSGQQFSKNMEKKTPQTLPIDDKNAKNNTPIPINADNNKTPKKNNENKMQDLYNKQQKNIDQKISTSLPNEKNLEHA